MTILPLLSQLYFLSWCIFLICLRFSVNLDQVVGILRSVVLSEQGSHYSH